MCVCVCVCVCVHAEHTSDDGVCVCVCVCVGACRTHLIMGSKCDILINVYNYTVA